jgi:hypothetical protein
LRFPPFSKVVPVLRWGCRPDIPAASLHQFFAPKFAADHKAQKFELCTAFKR